jgi:hypothetical protein
MPYVITRSDGTIVTSVADGTYDSTTSLKLIGKNLYNFGQLQNENFVYLLENFSKSTAPSNPLKGQLWFDTANQTLKVYNTAWRPLAVLSTSSSLASSLGNLWYDTVNKQLSINTGTGFSVIGPEGVSGYGTTRMVSATMSDASNTVHPVIKMYIDNELLSVLSKTTFSLNSSDPDHTSFPVIRRGLNFKNHGDQPSDTILYGTSDYALYADRITGDGSGQISAAISATPGTIVERDTSGGINVSTVNASAITSTNGIINGSWSVNNNLNPTLSSAFNLGSSGLQWNNVYSQNVNAGVVNSGVLNFSSALVDKFGSNVVMFDTDGTLVANSDARLPTQSAVKTYVDSKVSTSISSAIGALPTFTQSFNNGSLGTSGWTQMPNGMIMNWGYSQVGSGSSGVAFGSVTFPKPFTTHAMSAFCSTQRASAPGGGASGSGYISNLSTTGMTVGFDSDGTKQSGYWFAIGF